MGHPAAEFNRMCEEASRKDQEGTLTVGEIIHPGFYRLMEGEHAGRVIIKMLNSRIDGKYICFFANGMTWTWIDDIKDTRCESTAPKFSKPRHEVDRSKATWYPDGSDKPMSHEW